MTDSVPKTITSRDARIVIYTIAIQTMKTNSFDAPDISEDGRRELMKANNALLAQLEENLRYYQKSVA